ncbi:VOC family protein [Massilia sp. CF038]|uniref:VOC family protein n=1 Tax=Massilia sp. CF038 TaxID=1881045 RepID=UPI0009231BA3|nr:VOC family protein [Massilia sp. CF038]SHH05531.1 Catechol 2,3-dioxygenase [Massilia sp. CF038]
MISHVFIGITDYERALALYGAVMDALGMQAKFADAQKPWAGWTAPGQPQPLFVIARPFDQQAQASGNGQMVALLAPSRAAVDTAYAAALVHGAVSEGAPGLRPHYHANYYGAYFRDLDGNKLCVCCHDPL